MDHQPHIYIKPYIGGMDRNCSYLIWCSKTREALLIDPAVHPDSILKDIKELDLDLRGLVATHTHADHIRYINTYIDIYTNIQIFTHPKVLHPPEGIKIIFKNIWIFFSWAKQKYPCSIHQDISQTQFHSTMNILTQYLLVIPYLSVVQDAPEIRRATSLNYITAYTIYYSSYPKTQ